MSIKFEILGGIIVNGVVYEDDDMMKLLDIPGRVAYDDWRVIGDITKLCDDFSIAVEYTVDNEDGDPAWRDHFTCFCPNVMVDRIRALQADYAK